MVAPSAPMVVVAPSAPAVVVAPSAPAVVVARSAPPAVERAKGLLLLSNINALSNIVFFRCRSQKNR